jgi:hypothetical protein
MDAHSFTSAPNKAMAMMALSVSMNREANLVDEWRVSAVMSKAYIA